MPNEAYKRRLEEWEEKERERQASMEEPPAYDPGRMRSRIPLGCTIAVLAALVFLAWLVYRYLRSL